MATNANMTKLRKGDDNSNIQRKKLFLQKHKIVAELNQFLYYAPALHVEYAVFI